MLLLYLLYCNIVAVWFVGSFVCTFFYGVLFVLLW
jgi:hypothetical protein